MAFNVALTYAQRDSLISLQHTESLQQRTQRRLTSGREVNDVTDDVFRYFAAKSLADKSEELIEYNANVNQGISGLKANTDGLDKLVDLFKQIKGILVGSIGKDVNQLKSFNVALNSTLESAAELWDDIQYQGVSLIKEDIANALSLRFSDKHTLNIDSLDIFVTNSASTIARSGSGLAGTNYASQNRFISYEAPTATPAVPKTVSWALSQLLRGVDPTSTATPPTDKNYAGLSLTEGKAVILNSIAENVQDVIKTLRNRSQEIGIYIGILQVRFDYTNVHVSELNKGVDKYTLADINQEGAYLVALQTRQQLGLNALAVSGRQASAVLTLLQ